jgi:hypothetical protein
VDAMRYIPKKLKILDLTINRREYHILRCVDQDPYPEPYGRIKRRRRGYRGYWKSHKLWQHQIRMYRSWKHNRKTQWKK